jgi:hypothetical protein
MHRDIHASNGIRTYSLEWGQMVHALDSVATVIGLGSLNAGEKLYLFICSKTIAICSSETSIPIYKTARVITEKTRILIFAVKIWNFHIAFHDFVDLISALASPFLYALQAMDLNDCELDDKFIITTALSSPQRWL